MLALYDRVEIVKTGETGTIIEIDDADGENLYTVESDTETEDDYGTLYPQLFCRAEEIKPL